MRGERGIALLIVVSMLGTLAAITLTAFTLAKSQREGGLAALARVQARGAAEAALAQAFQGWPSALVPLMPGQEVQLASFAGPGPASGSASLRFLGGPIYAIRATGVRLSVAGDTLGLVRLELLARLGSPDSAAVIHPVPYPRGWRVLP